MPSDNSRKAVHSPPQPVCCVFVREGINVVVDILVAVGMIVLVGDGVAVRSILLDVAVDGSELKVLEACGVVSMVRGIVTVRREVASFG